MIIKNFNNYYITYYTYVGSVGTYIILFICWVFLFSFLFCRFILNLIYLNYYNYLPNVNDAKSVYQSITYFTKVYIYLLIRITQNFHHYVGPLYTYIIKCSLDKHVFYNIKGFTLRLIRQVIMMSYSIKYINKYYCRNVKKKTVKKIIIIQNIR